MTNPNFLLAQLAQALGNRPQQSFQPMWAEDQQRSLRPGFTDNYDYYNALKFGVRREGKMGGHMGSRVPSTGLLLKNPAHPTFYKTLQGEAQAGYEVYVGKDGRLYSRPKAKKK
jgi:hypothetical protein